MLRLQYIMHEEVGRVMQCLPWLSRVCFLAEKYCAAEVSSVIPDPCEATEHNSRLVVLLVVREHQWTFTTPALLVREPS